LNNPLVSILMTAYNREKYIAEAIDSVLLSSYSNFELIIVDDRSTDNTVNIAKSYEAKDSRIKVYLNEVNLKDYPNRNKAATYAKGKYIKYLDSDDTIYPWGLEAMVYSMEKYPAAAYGLIATNMFPAEAYPIEYTGEQAYKAFFFKCSLLTMGPSGSMIKRESFEKAGGFSEEPYIGDTEMWLRLLKTSSIVAMPPDLIWWRQHEQQQIKEGTDNSFYEKHTLNMFRSFLNAPDCPLKKEDAAIAMRNQLNIRSRKVIRDLFKLRFSKAKRFYKINQLSIGDLLVSVRKNKVVP